jgi:hypothetical protein
MTGAGLGEAGLGGAALAELACYLALGAALGAGYFALLHRALRLFTAEGSAERPAGGAAARFLAFYVLRFAAAGLVFYLVVQQGALPLLLSLLGFLLARLAGQRLAGGG